MLKRLFDVIVSLLVLIILFPMIILIFFVVFLFIGRPVLFKQRRAGLNGEIFEIIKFRTMNQKTDLNGELLPDVDRLSSFGRLLRSTSLDELPELINVLKGDMSLVGPRPLLEEYLPLYTEEQKRRHEVRPGITGLAQVSGRNLLSWEEKFKYDVNYVDNNNLIIDIKILVKTILEVFKKRGINQGHSMTAEKFKG